MNFIDEFSKIVEAMRENYQFPLIWIGLLWLVHIINITMKYRLNYLGIIPRHVFGLLGIFFYPFLHGSFEHLFLNSLPAYILINLVSLYGRETFYALSIFIILTSGLMVWLLGRHAIHIGASGLMMGYWGFLVMNAVHQGTAMAIILGFICIYYLGSMIMNVLPTQKGASWEGHFFGCLSGMAYGYLIPYFSYFSKLL